MTDPNTTALAAAAPAFVETAHRIVWATVATVDPHGHPRTRILHPIWRWDGDALTGWIATTPQSPKAADLAHNNRVSLTYWDTSHDVATADCTTRWITDQDGRHQAWDRFLHGPEPVGYDPSLIPSWTSADADAFGVLELTPYRLRVFPGSLLLTGQGELKTWKA